MVPCMAKTGKLKNKILRHMKGNYFATVLPLKYCEIFKNTNFEEHLRTAASV